MPEEKEDNTPMERLGPKGAVVNQPPDYDQGFKLLKEWVDSTGGPPEELRKKLRELFIDYHKPARKPLDLVKKREVDTRYSAICRLTVWVSVLL